MKKFIGLLLCLGLLITCVNICYADSWNNRKNKVKQLLKKNNLVNSDRFELTYAQKITDRMSNHFVYILKDTKTGIEYLLYTIGDGDCTKIDKLAMTPLLQPMTCPMPMNGQCMPMANKMQVSDKALDTKQATAKETADESLTQVSSDQPGVMKK
jgi:hypothetical protein